MALVSGCNPEKLPSLGRVSGTVTLDGQPVADANIMFEGAKSGEPPSLGKTDASGKYELYYSRKHKGATVGEHGVIITTYQPASDDNPQSKRESIPAKYNAKSELKSTVKRGQNKVDFDLKAGSEIIQPDDIEAAAVQPCSQAGGHVSAHTGPAPSLQAAADGVRDICFIGHELGGTSVEAGDFDEVLDQPVEVEYLLADQSRGRRGVPGQFRVLVEYVDHGRHRRQRSPQLMGHIPGELPGACRHLLQLTDLILQDGSHPVERGDQLGELVPALRLNPDRQVTAGHPRRGPDQPPYRQQDRTGRGDGHSDDHREQHPSLHPEKD